jgi:glycosyltransferase involved in cell wall biosynthesis
MAPVSIASHDIWILLPAYNEAPVIRDVIREVRRCGFLQILVVNDGSEDGTDAVALEEGALVISHPINRGAGAVVQTGIEWARHRGIQYLVQLDADGQHHPSDIPSLVRMMEERGCDLVIGSRFILRSAGIPRLRIYYNQISNLITNWFCDRWYTDTQSGFRMFNRKAIEQLDLHLDGFGYCSEMIIQAEHKGLRIEEVPIAVSYTAYSMSKGQDFYNGVVTAINLLWKLVVHPKR